MVSPPVSPATLRALAAEIRERRQANGITQTELAKRVGISKSGVSRLETAESMPANIDIAFMLRVLGVAGKDFNQIMALAGEVQQPNWLATDEPRLPQQLRALIDYERTVTAITTVHLTAFPGLLQTPEYARAILKTRYEPDDLEQLLKVRRERQAVLERDVRFVAFVDEPVLQSAVGGLDVVVPQLRHVLAMIQRENVTVRVIPFANPDARTELARSNSGYMLFEFPPKLTPVAYVELPPLGGTFFDERHTVDKLITMVARLHGLALSSAESAELITRSIDILESQ